MKLINVKMKYPKSTDLVQVAAEEAAQEAAEEREVLVSCASFQVFLKEIKQPWPSASSKRKVFSQ